MIRTEVFDVMLFIDGEGDGNGWTP